MRSAPRAKRAVPYAGRRGAARGVALALILAVLVGVPARAQEGGSGPDPDAPVAPPAATDAGTDAEPEAGTDAEPDAEPNAEPEAQTGAEIDAEPEAGAGPGAVGSRRGGGPGAGAGRAAPRGAAPVTHPTDADPSDEFEDEQDTGRGGRANTNPPSPGAKTFAAKFKEALALEAKVQDWEARSLKDEAIENLTGKRRERADRIVADTAHREQPREYAIAAQSLPAVGRDVRLTKEEIDVLIDIKRAHETTRSTRPLEHWLELNATFLEDYDWTQRDVAVALRDEVIARETALTDVLSQGKQILAGEATPDMGETVRKALRAVVPRVTQKPEERVEFRMLEDTSVRGSAFADMVSFLGDYEKARPASERLPDFGDESVQELQVAMIDAVGIRPLLDSTVALEAELTALDERIEVTPTKDDLQRRTQIIEHLNDNRETRYATPPEPFATSRLLAAQAGAIRGRLSELGSHGALYAHRADTLEEEILDRVDAGFPAAPTWETIDAQMVFLNELDTLGADDDPLAQIDLSDRSTNLEVLRKLLNSKALNELQAKAKASQKAAAPKKSARRPPPRSYAPKKKPQPKRKATVFKPRPRGGGGGRGGRGGRRGRPY